MRSGDSPHLFDVDQHREAASTAPLNTRVPGSPEWCYQTMGLLKSSYRHIHIDQENFTHYLSELREHRAWEKVPVDSPYGSEDKMLVAELGKRVDEIRAELDAAKQEIQSVKAKAINDAAPDLKPVGNQPKGYTEKKDITIKRRGTSNKYAVAKLRRAAPDIHARVLAGEITAHAGMIEAGFRKKAPSRKQTPLEKVRRLIAKLSPDDQRSLIAELLESAA